MGLIQVYTGPGKGKTTAALGLALRALGHGMKVAIVQFMKGQDDSGELQMAEKLEGFVFFRFGSPSFVDRENPDAADRLEAHRGLEKARELLECGHYDILILDEVNVALSFGLIDESEVLELMEKERGATELVMTGRNASLEIIRRADLVTEMALIKHPYDSGITARKGIEY